MIAGCTRIGIDGLCGYGGSSARFLSQGSV